VRGGLGETGAGRGMRVSYSLTIPTYPSWDDYACEGESGCCFERLATVWWNGT
jgi:hypothetical protein